MDDPAFEQKRTDFRNKCACETAKSSHQTRLLAKKSEKNCKKFAKITRNFKKLAKIARNWCVLDRD
jgi:hypothetical protein